MPARSLTLLCLALALCLPAHVFAQPVRDAKQWGMSVSFVPTWRVRSGDGPVAKLGELFFEQGDNGLSVDGADLRIGVVRGKHFGGEWGVSFVRRTFDQGSTQGAISTQCYQGGAAQEICSTYGTEYVYGDAVTLSGIEANKFISFVTIKNTVQIGLDIAGGVGWIKGTATERRAEQDWNFSFDPSAPSPIMIPFEIVETEVPVKTLLVTDPVPLGRVEFAAAVIVPGGVKVRVSGGLNFPGVHVASVTVMYFFGR